MELEDPVYDGDVPAVDLEDDNLPDSDVLLLVVGEKQQVSSLKHEIKYINKHCQNMLVLNAD